MRIPTTLLLLLYTCFAHAQTSALQGVLQDADGGAVVYANIALYNASDSSLAKASASDDAGKFTLQGLKPGSYYLKAIYLGLNDLYTPNLTLADAQSLDLGARVECATPHELVAMLFEGLRDALGGAERALAHGRAALRVKSVTRALAILDALDASLDFTRGRDVARALAAVYAQVRVLIVAGNAEARRELFSAAAGQIAELDEAWSEIEPQG